MGSFTESIRSLAESTAQNRALNNGFYEIWLSRRLTGPQAATFARNYCAWIETVPDQIARVFLSHGDLEAKCETIKNLFSEMGFGDPEKTHISMLRRYMSDLVTRVQGSPYNVLEDKRPLLSTTHNLTKIQQELFGNNDPQVSAGALLAQEWQAYTMLVQLYEGARLYMPLYGHQIEFHEACEYFYLHIGEAEKEHKVQSIHSAEKYCHSQGDFERIRAGYDGFLKALEGFWIGLAEDITKTDAR